MNIPGESGSVEFKPCPPDVKGVIAGMEAAMRRPENNHAGVPSQVAVKLMKDGIAASFAEVEVWFRELDSRVHLLAVPLDYCGSERVDNIQYFSWQAEGKPEFGLWVGVNGDEEVATMMQALGIDETENLRRLPSTGVLFA